MAIRSMTGFAQVQGRVREHETFTLSLKSVNHRFLDLHVRMPAQKDALEMKLRRILKAKLARGHIELTLAVDGAGTESFAINREFVGRYIRAFQSAVQEFGISSEPDLNAILKLPGALGGSDNLNGDPEFDNAIVECLNDAIALLDRMRVEEGRAIERELRERMARLHEATVQVEKLRSAVAHAYLEKISFRMKELVGTHVEKDRILQEAALLAERSDVQEEIVRLHTHIQHFLGLLEHKGEIGKQLDFLLQEMNRESNTLLSKTSSVAGEGLRITELGLAMKSEIEKAREQVQNVE